MTDGVTTVALISGSRLRILRIWCDTQDADAAQNGASSSLVALDDNQRYDDSFAWSTAQSCVNGEGWLYFRNTCLREITIQLKVGFCIL